MPDHYERSPRAAPACHRSTRSQLLFLLGAMLAAFVSLVGTSLGAADIPDVRAAAAATDGEVYAFADSGHGTMYIGGRFEQVGQYNGRGVIFSREGEPRPFPLVEGSGVSDVVADGSGGWFVGGNFDSVGGLPRKNLAHVLADGNVDPVWNPGANGFVNALERVGSTVYVSGAFTEVAGQARARLAAIGPLGVPTSWNPGADGPIYDLEAAGDTLYLGGTFQNVGGAPRSSAAALDIPSGAVTSWNPNVGGTVSDLAVSSSEVFLSGGWSTVGGVARGGLAVVDRSTGSLRPWDPLSGPGNAGSLKVVGSTLYVAGGFVSIAGQPRSRLAAFSLPSKTLTDWDPAPNGQVTTLGVAGTDIIVGGQFTMIAGQPRAGLATVDQSGSALPWSGGVGKNPLAIAESAGSIYVGGSFTYETQVARKNLAEVNLATGQVTAWNPGVTGGGVPVRSLQRVGAKLYVGGEFSSVAGQTRARIAAFDTTTGTLGTWNPGSNGAVWVMSSLGSTLYVGGAFTSAGGATRKGLAGFDTNTGALTVWNPNISTASALTSQVTSLEATSSGVYAAGTFTTIGGQTRNHLAQLDLTNGTATGFNPNVNYAVTAMAVSAGAIYIVGPFNRVGSVERKGIAAFDRQTGTLTALDPLSRAGGAWSSTPDFNDIAVSTTRLYVSGSFTSLPVSGQNIPRAGIAAFDLGTGSLLDWGRYLSRPQGAGALFLTDTALYVDSAAACGGLSWFVTPPENTGVPALSGPASVGTSLSVSSGSWAGDLPSYTVQWLRSGVPIAGATGSVYAPTSADTGRALSARVTAANLGGRAAATTAATTVEGPPVNDVLPAINGRPHVGTESTVTRGDWRVSPVATYSYQWQRCPVSGCVDIVAATSATYSPAASDLSAPLRVRVTAANTRGVTAAYTTPSDPVRPPDTHAPTIQLISEQPSTWERTGIRSFRALATDDDVGVQDFVFTTVHGETLKTASPCVASCAGEASEASHAVMLSDLPEGDLEIAAASRDAAGNRSAPAIAHVKVDRTSPSIFTSGAFDEERVTVAKHAVLHVKASDGTEDASGTAGVIRVEMRLDGELVDPATDRIQQTCVSGGCALRHSFALEPLSWGTGEHVIDVTAVDAAGNTNVQRLNIEVRQPPSCENASAQVSPTFGSGPAVSDSAALAAVTSTAAASVAPAVDTAPQGDPMRLRANSFVSDGAESQTAAAVQPAAGVRASEGSQTITVAPTTISDVAHPGVQVQDSSVLYANVARGADVVTRADEDGTDVYVVSRTSSAPEEFSWNVCGAKHQTLEEAPDGSVLVIDEDRKAEIPEPVYHPSDATDVAAGIAAGTTDPEAHAVNPNAHADGLAAAEQAGVVQLSTAELEELMTDEDALDSPHTPLALDPGDDPAALGATLTDAVTSANVAARADARTDFIDSEAEMQAMTTAEQEADAAHTRAELDAAAAVGTLSAENGATGEPISLQVSGNGITAPNPDQSDGFLRLDVDPHYAPVFKEVSEPVYGYESVQVDTARELRSWTVPSLIPFFQQFGFEGGPDVWIFNTPQVGAMYGTVVGPGQKAVLLYFVEVPVYARRKVQIGLTTRTVLDEEATAQMSQAGARCKVAVQDLRNPIIAANDADWEARTRKVVFDLRATCTGTDTIRATSRVCLQYQNRFGKWIQVETTCKEIDQPTGAERNAAVSLVCDSTRDGTRPYRLYGKYEGWFKGVPAHREDERRSTAYFVACPTTDDRRYNEADSWHRLASTRSGNRGTTVSTAPGSLLREALGPPPTSGDYYWAAHHIIPHSDGRARVLRAAAFRCHVHPNEDENGIYLRGYPLSIGTHAYEALPQSLKERTYHARTQGPDYFVRLGVHWLLNGISPSDDRCVNSAVFRGGLADIKDQLKEGTFFAGPD